MKNFVTAATTFVIQPLSIQVILELFLFFLLNYFLFLRACDEFGYRIIKSSLLMTIVNLTSLPDYQNK